MIMCAVGVVDEASVPGETGLGVSGPPGWSVVPLSLAFTREATPLGPTW